MNEKIHIGIIMDGNRRRAKNLGKTTFQGHTAGFENAKKMVEIIYNLGIADYFTLWCLSKENIQKRSKEELDGLYSIIGTLVDLESIFKDKDIRFDTIGDLTLLPQRLQDLLTEFKQKTKNNSKMTFVAAIGYSGQDDIVRATKNIINLGINPESLDENEFRKYLDLGKLPVIDLIIRTGIHTGTNAVRHSGFLLYDCAYSEYYFTHTTWPDFDENELHKALEEFRNTKRTKGK